MGNSRSQGTAAKKGEIFSAVVRDVASDGRGIVSHTNGLTVFVPGVWPGERVRVRFTGLQGRVGTAEPVELIQPSPHRTQPQCPHHGFYSGECGGCPWQFINYTAQLDAKQQRVEKAFADFKKVTVNKIWPSPCIYGYRNRAQLKTNGVQIGYLTQNSHTLAVVEDCPILTELNRHTLQQLRQRLPQPHWHGRGNHKWRTLHIDESVNADQVKVDERLPFQQSNTPQNRRMGEWLARQCETFDKSGAVLELFCGAGNFTEILSAAGFTRIVAVDSVGPAIEQLQEKQLPHVTAVNADLFEPDAFTRLYRQHRDFTTLVLDPPRDGLKNKTGLLTNKQRFAHILYVSCNLATLVRDLEYFAEHGYRVEQVQPLDMAPHTPHIEILTRLRHKSA